MPDAVCPALSPGTAAGRFAAASAHWSMPNPLPSHGWLLSPGVWAWCRRHLARLDGRAWWWIKTNSWLSSQVDAQGSGERSASRGAAIASGSAQRRPWSRRRPPPVDPGEPSGPRQASGRRCVALDQLPTLVPHLELTGTPLLSHLTATAPENAPARLAGSNARRCTC